MRLLHDDLPVGLALPERTAYSAALGRLACFFCVGPTGLGALR
jgi:hypothetical protein